MTLTDWMVIDQVGCARCEGDGHPGLGFSLLTHPVVVNEQVTFTYWAPCPTNGEPILLAVMEKPA